ncbi:MAG: L,D-transpeptidase, partial [Myxococcota bacterium]
GDGCSSGVWAEIAPSTYVCDADVRYGRFAPEVQAHPVLAPGALLPYAYGFVMVDGARSYAHPQDYFTDQYYEALGIGFGIIVDRREFYEGLEFVRTRRRLFIPANSVRMARGSDFVGVVLDDAGFTGVAFNAPGSPTGANAAGEATADAAERSAQSAGQSAQSAERNAAETVGPLSIAWSRRSVAVRSRRGGGRRLRTLGRRTAVRVRAIERRWAELEDGGFVRVRDLHRPERQPAPEGATTWIDIDISEQTLVAYRGETPVYATLISSGRRGRHHATPIGEHRVWVKLAFSDMDNLQRENVARNYAIERVPWVQYFAGANGLHAAFWHDEFGRRKSHGCINLAPRDAQALFAFTEPALPTGWTAIFPRPDEPTTVVVVRP